MASNWPLRGMKRTLWEGGVRANGFVSGAGLKKSGYTSDALLHAVDIPISLLVSSPDQRSTRMVETVRAAAGAPSG